MTNTPAILSPRQIEVLDWLSRGKTAEEVGVILGVEMSTVMFHYSKAAEALGTSNRAHTIAEAFRRGLLS